jgi:hypothetical protein
MIDPGLLSRLEEAFQLLGSSFVRYIAESSEPEVHDDADKKAQALYEDWSRESRYSQMALGDLLAEEGCIPSEGSFPIELSQFNFLSPAYLLRHMIDHSSADLERLSELARSLSSWPRAGDLLGAVIVRQRYYLDRAKKLAEACEKKLEEARAKEPPKPPRIKGTSASRW